MDMSTVFVELKRVARTIEGGHDRNNQFRVKTAGIRGFG